MRATGATSACLLLMAALGLASLSWGALDVPVADLVRALVGSGTPEARTALALRGPRVLAALLVGGGLAAAGAAFQTIFRNPLVAPDLLGVSSGSALGASTCLLLGGSFALVQATAFAGGLAAVALALAAARAARSGDPRLSLVLCGIVTGALAAAGLALVITLADPYTQLPTISYWLLGSLSRATLGEVAAAAVPSVAGFAILLLLGSRLDLLALGDEQARSLGLSASKARGIVIVGSTLMTAAAVSVAGVVGWIGLLAPHAARLAVGSEARRLMPMSAAVGASFALAIDVVARSGRTVELPLGLLTAGIGAPVFLGLFIWTGRR